MREIVGLGWELGDPGPDGRALSVTETLTASLHEKSKFYSRVLALTGGREPPAGFDLAGLLGRGAIVTTAHVARADKTFCNVTAVGPLPRGLAAPVPSISPVFFDIETPDPAAYAAMPARFRKLADTAIGANPAAPQPAAAGPWTGAPAPAWGSQPPAPPPAPRQPAPPAPQAAGPDWNDEITF